MSFIDSTAATAATHSETLLKALTERASVPAAALTEPAPTSAALQKAFQAAMTAPDHKALRPWRFVIIDVDQRLALGDLMVQASIDLAHQKGKQLAESKQAKIRQKPLRAPLIVAVVMHEQDNPKVPREEQLITTGIAAYNFMLALQAQNYGAVWLSGNYTQHKLLHSGLNLLPNELLLGFLYCGTAKIDLQSLQATRAKHRRPAEAHVRTWTPATTS